MNMPIKFEDSSTFQSPQTKIHLLLAVGYLKWVLLKTGFLAFFHIFIPSNSATFLIMRIIIWNLLYTSRMIWWVIRHINMYFKTRHRSLAAENVPCDIIVHSNYTHFRPILNYLLTDSNKGQQINCHHDYISYNHQLKTFNIDIRQSKVKTE